MQMKAVKQRQIILDKIYEDKEPSVEELQQIFPALYSKETLTELEKRGEFAHAISPVY